jgi:hypothetical protein
MLHLVSVRSSLPALRFLIVLFLTGLCGTARVSSAQTSPTVRGKEPASQELVKTRSMGQGSKTDESPTREQATAKTGEPIPKDTRSAPTPTDGRTTRDGMSISTPGVLPALASLLGALLTGTFGLYFLYRNIRLSKAQADRMVRVEAQKLLLEINKLYVSNPALLAIYDDHPGRAELLKEHPTLEMKLKALAYLKINVFEIVFAVHPNGPSDGPWMAYFKDSLARCGTLREELSAHPELYHESLIGAYREWEKSSGVPPTFAASPTSPAAPLPTAPAP